MAGFFGRGFFGGMGGRGGMDEEDTKEIDNKKLYEVLEVDPKASDAEIRKNYKRLTLKYHPDREGGNEEKFKEVNFAYEIVSDREKRELYDRYGLEGVKNNGGGGGGGFEDIFDIINGGGGRKNRGNREKPKMKPTVKEVNVKLEDIYNGKLIEIPHKKTVLCNDCHGTGGTGCKKCQDCDGQGAVMKTIQVGPGMYQRAQMACNKCQGKGEIIDPANICKTCKAKKVSTQEKKVQVSVEAGTPSDHVIKISGEGDEHPEAQAGDLLVKVNVQKHPLFQRQGADLFLEKTISLKEALLGFNFDIPFLDGKKIKVSSVPGEVITHGDVKTVKGKGLPFYRDLMNHGNLIIKFKVQFPDSNKLSAECKETLQKVLPGGTTGPADKSVKPEYLLEFHESDANTNPSGGHGNDEEDEDPRGGGRQECVVQ